MNLWCSHTTNLCWPCWKYILYRSVGYMESVLDNVFKQIRAQRRLAPGCFGWMLWRFFLVVRACETQTKRNERGISCIAITKYYQWSSWSNAKRREAGISAIAFPCRGTMRWCEHSFLKPKAIIVVLAFLKAGFNKRKASPGAFNLITARRTNPAWLIFCLGNGKTKIS